MARRQPKPSLLRKELRNFKTWCTVYLDQGKSKKWVIKIDEWIAIETVLALLNDCI